MSFQPAAEGEAPAPPSREALFAAALAAGAGADALNAAAVAVDDQ
jgi:hypothetical protein